MTEQTKKTLAEYWDMLVRHDWFYQYSDDHSVYKAGSRAQGELYVVAAQGPEFKALFDACSAAKFADPSKPFPPRPQ